ncbi:MAG: PH domain-containing protein [Candidatus Portnoybacteria bacterium]|nr:PH domain-containing protein [Candidatus Portnoybacteria bacterium]
MPNIFTASKHTFEKQLPEETTILLTRKHWISFYFPFAIIVILILLPFILSVIISSFSWYKTISPFYWFIVTTYLLILWHLIFYNVMIYMLNTVVVTNRRIIENQQLGFFKHTVSEMALNRIQDITVSVFGVVAEFLKFGDIEIQTAGEEKKFFFHLLPNPRAIKDMIMAVKMQNLREMPIDPISG